MDKSLTRLTTILISALLIVSIVYAAGSSTGGSSGESSSTDSSGNEDNDGISNGNLDTGSSNSIASNNNNNPDNNNLNNYYTNNYDNNSNSASSAKQNASAQTVINCETYGSMSTRIKCRLENSPNVSTTQEDCRGLVDSDRCTQLYEASKVCYEMTGISKDKCFREKTDSLESSRRNYLILLLYNLQEKVEDKYKQGTISSGTATELITDIVAIKKLVHNGKLPADLRTVVTQLKAKWGVLMK